MIIDEKTTNNLAKLKEYFLDSEDEDTKITLTSWEKSLFKLQSLKGYNELDVTKDILKYAQKKVININKLLFLDEKLEEIERKLLYRERKVWMYLVKIFSSNHQSEIDQIKEAIERQVESIDEI